MDLKKIETPIGKVGDLFMSPNAWSVETTKSGDIILTCVDGPKKNTVMGGCKGFPQDGKFREPEFRLLLGGLYNFYMREDEMFFVVEPNHTQKWENVNPEKQLNTSREFAIDKTRYHRKLF